MAIIASKTIKKGQVPSAYEAGKVLCKVFEYAWTADLGSGDITEFAVLPAHCVPVKAVVKTASIGATATLDVGIMSGTPGDTASARTVGSEFVNDGTKNTTITADEFACAAIAASDVDRGIGIALSAAETVGGGETVQMALYYKAA